MIKQRILRVSLFEIIAIMLIGVGGYLLTDESWKSSGLYAFINSSVAVTWNYAFNTGFERWERTQSSRKRTVARRIVHCLGYEAGLVVMLVPLMAHWFNTTLTMAFIANLGILAFFLIYTFSFNWLFDYCFERELIRGK